MLERDLYKKDVSCISGQPTHRLPLLGFWFVGPVLSVLLGGDAFGIQLTMC